MVSLKFLRNMAVVILLMIVGMTVYEWFKEYHFPHFSKWESHIVTIIFTTILATVIAYIVFRKRENYITVIDKELIEKRIILQEVHHRIKNNMISIQSMINIKKDDIDNSECSLLLEDIGNHISGMMHLYDNLYRNKQYEMINIKKYFDDIVSDLSKYYLKTEISIESNFEYMDVPISIGYNLAIVVNELVSNSIKYAFNDKQSGKIIINIISVDNNILQLQYRDNGIGLPDNVDVNNPTSFGLILINSISSALGSYSIYNANGLNYHLQIEIK